MPPTPNPTPPLLDTESAYYRLHRAEWVAEGHAGQWVVIKHEDLLGFFPDVATAYGAGVRKHGAVPFLVKEVRAEDEPPAILHRTTPRRAH